MDTLTDWTSAVCSDLGLNADELDCAVATRIEHEVRRGLPRSMAPVTVYLLGVAVGRGLSPEDAAARLDELIRQRCGIDWRD
ncbi:MAG: hypothetical protein GEU98_21020 [Pseudonocardiaceae bacterium]|nr:hypothetical protein [Pseudonocardiaceae bacterium]